MSANLKARATALCQEALQCITIALVGSDTRKFWTLMTAYFGANQTGDEEDDPWSFLDVTPTIPAPLPLTDTETDEETISVRSAPASTAPSKESAPVKCKPLISTQKDLLEDLCTLREAIHVYP